MAQITQSHPDLGITQVTLDPFKLVKFIEYVEQALSDFSDRLILLEAQVQSKQDSESSKGKKKS